MPVSVGGRPRHQGALGIKEGTDEPMFEMELFGGRCEEEVREPF
jgi:hypothetical protein